MFIYLSTDLLLAICAALAAVWGHSSALAAAVVLMLLISLEREFSHQSRGRLRDALATISVAAFFLASGAYLLADALHKAQEVIHITPKLWVIAVSALIALIKILVYRAAPTELRQESTAISIVYLLIACGVALSSTWPWQDTVLSMALSVLILYHSGEMGLLAVEELSPSEGIPRPSQEE